jgi:hypothetical protein
MLAVAVSVLYGGMHQAPPWVGAPHCWLQLRHAGSTAMPLLPTTGVSLCPILVPKSAGGDVQHPEIGIAACLKLLLQNSIPEHP